MAADAILAPVGWMASFYVPEKTASTTMIYNDSKVLRPTPEKLPE
jgi:hypothetical protein